jgi:hypothetical protein
LTLISIFRIIPIPIVLLVAIFRGICLSENIPKRPKGAQKGNRNAAKLGEDLRLELFLSKWRRGFLEEWFVLKCQ